MEIIAKQDNSVVERLSCKDLDPVIAGSRCCELLRLMLASNLEAALLDGALTLTRSWCSISTHKLVQEQIYLTWQLLPNSGDIIHENGL